MILGFFSRKSVNFVSTFHMRGRFKFTELVPGPIIYKICSNQTIRRFIILVR